ncbi:hypothetical protein AB852_02585 [Streptomyces uncialis]|uniref:DUF4232 domain-containing protein n=1 Tax=Streptomyces uncialis TaxID=1048205 RepID=A0A1Q4VCY1_9ACTN|nr:hypothetical protein AB852_02585 [Streptomyces uncialis]
MSGDRPHEQDGPSADEGDGEPRDRTEEERNAGNATVNESPSGPHGTEPIDALKKLLSGADGGTGDPTPTRGDHATDKGTPHVNGVPHSDKHSAATGSPTGSASTPPGRPNTPAVRLDTDEDDEDGLELRGLLHQAVQDLEPSDGTLDHLRRAVPARRARKRQALVGAAAAALLIGTAVPALVRVANNPGSTETQVSHVGHGKQTRGTSSEAPSTEQREGRPSKGPRKPSGSASSPGKGGGPGEKDKPAERTTGGTDTGPGSGTPGTAPGTGSGPGSGTSNATSPSCGPTDLGSAVANVGDPGPDGKVYGTFTVANVSSGDCTVDGGGSVDAAGQGAADSTRLAALTHTDGDAATGLPSPASVPSQIILEPGSSYEVRFAWVPSEECPTDGGGNTTGPSPDPTPSEGASSGTGGTAETSGGGAESPQLGGQEGLPQDGSVSVSHTAEPGSPSTTATIPDACAGTVYYTGALPAS